MTPTNDFPGAEAIIPMGVMPTRWFAGDVLPLMSLQKSSVGVAMMFPVSRSRTPDQTLS